MENSTEPIDAAPLSVWSTILTVVPITFIMIVIVFGNALVIVAVLCEDRLKNKIQNWLIVSLSVADLWVGVLIMPLTLTKQLLRRWIFGTLLCEAWLALDVLFVTASILNLCVISIDRYWSLSDPVYSAAKRTRKRTILMILCIWGLAFLISFPPLVGWQPEHRQPGVCDVSHEIGYVLYSALGSFYIPLAILMFIYAKIFCITRHRVLAQRRKVRQHQHLLRMCQPEKPPDPSSSAAAASQAPPDASTQTLLPAKKERAVRGSPPFSSNAAAAITETSSRADETSTVAIGQALILKPFELQMRIMNHRKLVRRRERQATMLLGLILGAFTISWLPFFCAYVLQAICCTAPELVFDVIFWLGYCNSALNPIIYSAYNNDFRLAFQKLLCRRGRR